MDSPGRLAAISDMEQLAAVADPMRLSLLRMLMARPATLTQLADALGTYPARVRYHVKRLEQVGLVKLVRCVKRRNYVEKYYEAAAAAYVSHLMVVPERNGVDPLVVLHCDPAVEVLGDLVRQRSRSVDCATVFTSSLDGLIALRLGLADVAGCHLLDSATGQYNVPHVQHLFPGRPMAMVTLADREQGLVVQPGNPLHITRVEDLAQPDVRMVNREPGSGTRIWLDIEIGRLGIAAEDLEGYDAVVETHAAVADAVLTGSADAGIAPRPVASAAGLGFVPLYMERYDLVMDEHRTDEAAVAQLLETLTSNTFRKRLAELGGYDVLHLGDARLTA